MNGGCLPTSQRAAPRYQLENWERLQREWT